MAAVPLFHDTDVLSQRDSIGNFAAKKLGLNDKQFAALKLVLRLLDTVFRFGQQEYFQNNFNTVAKHSLDMAKKLDKLFEPICNRDGIDEINFRAIEEAKRTALLSALVHDAGEAIMEFSTVDGRIIGSEILTDEERHDKERKIAMIIFDLAIKAVENNDESILVDPIKKARKAVIKSNKSVKQIINKFISDYSSKTVKKDARAFVRAFNRAEYRDDLIGVLVKTVDAIDGNEFITEYGIGLEKRDTAVVDHVVGKLNSLKNTLARFRILIDSTMKSLTENARMFMKEHGSKPDNYRVLFD